MLDDGRGEGFLAFEVVVEGALGHAGLVGDLLDAGGVVAGSALNSSWPAAGEASGMSVLSAVRAMGRMI